MQRIVEQKRVFLTFALVAVLAIAAGGAYLAARLSGVRGPQMAAPRQLKPSDFWPGEGGVLHIVYPRIAGYVDKGEPGEGEIWFDPRNSRAREELRWDDGTIELLRVARGDYYDEYKVEGGTKTDPVEVTHSRLLNGAAWSGWLSTSELGFSGAVQAGMVGTEIAMVHGQPALRLEIPVIGEGGERLPSRILYLDATTFLPIAGEQTDDAGRKTIQDAQYKVIEWVPQERVDPNLFELPANLRGALTESWQEDMTVSEARSFVGVRYLLPRGFFPGAASVRTAILQRKEHATEPVDSLLSSGILRRERRLGHHVGRRLGAQPVGGPAKCCDNPVRTQERRGPPPLVERRPGQPFPDYWQFNRADLSPLGRGSAEGQASSDEAELGNDAARFLA
ncbi:MAG: hypothetical protein ABSG55_10495 [Dehalococcoidia bacterium]